MTRTSAWFPSRACEYAIYGKTDLIRGRNVAGRSRSPISLRVLNKRQGFALKPPSRKCPAHANLESNPRPEVRSDSARGRRSFRPALGVGVELGVCDRWCSPSPLGETQPAERRARFRIAWPIESPNVASVANVMPPTQRSGISGGGTCFNSTPTWPTIPRSAWSPGPST